MHHSQADEPFIATSLGFISRGLSTDLSVLGSRKPQVLFTDSPLNRVIPLSHVQEILPLQFCQDTKRFSHTRTNL